MTKHTVNSTFNSTSLVKHTGYFSQASVRVITLIHFPGLNPLLWTQLSRFPFIVFFLAAMLIVVNALGAFTRESALFTQHVFLFVNLICLATYNVIPIDIRPFSGPDAFQNRNPNRRCNWVSNLDLNRSSIRIFKLLCFSFCDFCFNLSASTPFRDPFHLSAAF